MPLKVLLLIILGCGKSATEEVKTGRLKYVETHRYGSVGSHDRDSRSLYVNDKKWSPDGIKMEDFGDCATSPNSAVEVIKCFSFRNNQKGEINYIFRMKNDQPEWTMTPEASDVWVGDGHWLLSKDFYFNVETSEQKQIKGLPEKPEDFFMAASTDLGTVIYQEECFHNRFDLSPDDLSEKEKDRQCEVFSERRKNGIATFWVIDIMTGKVKILELSKEKYDWAV